MRTLHSHAACAASVVGLFATAAAAQWVEFTDDTATNLDIAPILVTDTLEKDIFAADLDKDGLTDAVIVRKTRFSTPGAQTDILLMNEGGVLRNRTATFAPGFNTTPTDARDVWIIDVDGDTWDDVIIANTFGEQPRIYMNQGESAGVWQGLADESASRLPTVTPLGPLQFCALWAGDVTGDNRPEIYFSNYTPFDPKDPVGTTDVLLVNDGNGNFTDQTNSRLRTGAFGDLSRVAFGTSCQILDIDNDGDNDIVKLSTLYAVAPWNARGIFALFNDGNGFFNTVPYQDLSHTINAYMFLMFDMTNDTMLDVFFVNDTDDTYRHATALTPNGPNTYDAGAAVGSARLSVFGGNLRDVDIDNDGDLDLGVTPVDTDIANCSGFFASEFTLLQNDGAASGTLLDTYAGSTLNWHQRPFDIAFLDVNNDGLMDMLMGNCDGYSLHLQTCTPAANCFPCDGDADANDIVDINDIAFVIFRLGNAGAPGIPGDVDGNGIVDINDVAYVIFRLGTPCP